MSLESIDLTPLAFVLQLLVVAFVCRWLLTEADRKYEDCRKDLANERARSQMLTNTIIDMKLSGGSVQRLNPLPAGERLKQKDRTDIEIAIAQNKHARRIPGLAAYLAKWADEALLDPAADREHVLDRLRTWSTVSEDDSDDDDEEDDLEEGTVNLGDDDDVEPKRDAE